MKTVLVLAANPIESARVQFHQELSQIQQCWERSRDGFQIKFEPAATWVRWRQQLLDCQPEIVHFIGHGVGREGLVLEGEIGQQEMVSGDRLARLLLEFPTVRCVVLNACHSQVQAQAIFDQVGHVRSVVGMKQSIAQESARVFAIAFYDAVFGGQEYDRAFRLGKTGIKSQFDDFKPKLFWRGEMVEMGVKSIDVESPVGRVAFDSKFYMPRPTAEADAEREIVRPGALIRIRAPREFGKTSLMGRVVNLAERQGAKTVTMNCREIPSEAQENLDSFLHYFCDLVTLELGLDGEMEQRRIKSVGVKKACTHYFETVILPQVLNSLVLELDEVDVLINLYPQQRWVSDFFSMLRAWYDSYMKAKDSWKKLRLVLVHSKQVEQDFLRGQSPFNVGFEIELGEFNEGQVLELARLHGVSETIARQLFQFVGGHPKLVRKGLYEIAQGRSIAEIFECGATHGGIYGDYLQQIRACVESDNALATDWRRVVASGDEGAEIGRSNELLLRSLGIILSHRNRVRVACSLHRQYFLELWK
jgi:AAA-like domain/CHAT domain